MTDVMRDMINQLMGAQRAEEEGRRLPPYDHHSVCRAYLYGCCPADILVDTRLDSLVICRKLHEAALKGQYEREQEKKDHFYDIEAFETLGMAIRAVDVDINKIKDKLERENKEHADGVEYVKAQKIHDINEQIGKALAKMEELGNEGKVEESMQLSQTVEELKTKKEQMHIDLRTVGASNLTQRQQLRVCEDCGAQLNLLDHETRLADHFGGKMHLGMVDIRAKYTEMKETIEERKKARMEAGVGSSYLGERGGGDRRDRDRDRRRSPDRRESRGGGDRDRREERDGRDRRDRSRSRDRSRRDDRRGGSSRDERRDDRRGGGERDYRRDRR